MCSLFFTIITNYALFREHHAEAKLSCFGLWNMKYFKCSSIRPPCTATEFLMVQSQAEPSRIPLLPMHAWAVPRLPSPSWDWGDTTLGRWLWGPASQQQKSWGFFLIRKKKADNPKLQSKHKLIITKAVSIVLLIRPGQVCVSSVKICSRTSAESSSSQRQAWSGSSLTGGLLLWWGGYKTRQARRTRGRGCRVADEEDVKVPVASKWPKPCLQQEECMIDL